MTETSCEDRYTSDADLRRIGAPYTGYTSLLSRNEGGLRLLLDSLEWSTTKLTYLQTSGFLDYFVSSNGHYPLSLGEETDMFKEWRSATPTLIDGKVYVRLSTGIESIYSKKFEQLADEKVGGKAAKTVLKSIPSKRQLGYEYLIPINSTFVGAIDLVQDKWDKLDIDLEKINDMKVGEAKAYLTDLKFYDIADHVATILEDIKHLTFYGAIVNVWLYTADAGPRVGRTVWPYTGSEIKVTFESDYQSFVYSINQLINRFIPQEIMNDDYLEQFFVEYVKAKLFPNLLVVPATIELPQYRLPELPLKRDCVTKSCETQECMGDVELVKFHLGELSFSQQRSFFYLEAIMALAAKGLLTLGSGKDYLKQIARHLDQLPYLRYPINMFGYHWDDVISRLEYYQADYSSILARRVQPLLAERLDSAYIFLTRQDEPDYWNPYPERITKLMLSRDNPRHLEEIYDDSIEIPLENQVVESLAYCRVRISGVEFRTKDIMTIFNNTPLASALMYSPTYDPSWLKSTDIKLIKDMLEGRLTPYALYNGLSQEAFINLSPQYSFLWLYENGQFSLDLNMNFILGEKMYTTLQDVENREQTATSYGNRFKTFISSFK